jgi:hypothetical protein
MPTSFRLDGYRFFFYSLENNEPPHVHVRASNGEAKFWLIPTVELADNRGFARHELNRLLRLIEEHRERILKDWHEHFDD